MKFATQTQRAVLSLKDRLDRKPTARALLNQREGQQLSSFRFTPRGIGEVCLMKPDSVKELVYSLRWLIVVKSAFHAEEEVKSDQR